MSLNYRIIGTRMKTVRNRHRMTQADLAEQAGLSVPYISRIETAAKKASLSSLVRIADALGVTVDYLLTGNQAFDNGTYAEDLFSLFENSTNYEKQIIFEVATAVKESLSRNLKLISKGI